MKFTLETLTPLWTAGTDPKNMDRVHETGIIGSLRWWYEAVLRGLVDDNSICIPTGEADQRCNYEKHKRVCKACDLFGATGWKRRFRLELNGGSRLFTTPINIKIRPDGNGWYFSPPYVSDSGARISGQVTVLRQRAAGSSSIENDLCVVAELINRCGALGPKTQHGWGVVNMKLGDSTQPDIGAFLRGLPEDSTDDQGLPTIGNMFFANLYLRDGIADNWWKNANLGSGVKDKVRRDGREIDHANAWRLPSNFSVPTAPAVKYKLRYGNNSPYIPEAGKCEPFFFGEISKPAVKAKINISNAYKLDDGWQFRIWGWFPEQNLPGSTSRDQLMKELHNVVTKDQAFWDDNIFGNGVIDLSKSVWREVDRCGHNRNTPDATGSAVIPTTSAALLRYLLG